jgi:glycyl-tRNA synthetase
MHKKKGTTQPAKSSPRGQQQSKKPGGGSPATTSRNPNQKNQPTKSPATKEDPQEEKPEQEQKQVEKQEEKGPEKQEEKQVEKQEEKEPEKQEEKEAEKQEKEPEKQVEKKQETGKGKGSNKKEKPSQVEKKLETSKGKGSEKEKPKQVEKKLETSKGKQEEKKNIDEKPKEEVDPKIAARHALEELLKRRFFYVVAYEIYGGVKGLYDYGPPGSAMLTNIIDFWREFFILEENMLQVQTAALTPEIVFQTSGHVDKFQDYMVRDLTTHECYRADHLLEDVLEAELKTKSGDEKKELEKTIALIDDLDGRQLGELLTKYNVKSPDGGNEISDPFPFNLMFSTSIGPTGKYKGYFRPETAQGMFVNFSRLLEQNNTHLPFAAAQIGPAYRNEIAPRSGLLRVREFTLAEIEHFVDPRDKSHPKFSNVSDIVLPLLSKESQVENTGIVHMSIGEAVTKGIVNSQTLGYFLARVYLFLIRTGVKSDKLRFRQHLSNEMAHYACDCWDAEIHTSYGWIECVGNADRSCYDLKVHEKASGKKFNAFIPFPDGPRDVEVYSIEVDKGTLGKSLKGAAKPVLSFFDEIKDDNEKILELQEKVSQGSTIDIAGVSVPCNLLSFSKRTKKAVGKSIQPNVIEPAFGLGRILYCLLEHSYYCRENDEQRAVLALAPIVAPYKTSVLPLVSNDDNINALIPRIVKLLTKNRISYKTDTTGVSIGRRYARTDEIGIPFAITIDFEGLSDDTVTLRERDSRNQVRVKIEEVPSLLNSLIDVTTSWEETRKKYPNVVIKKDLEVR